VSPACMLLFMASHPRMIKHLRVFGCVYHPNLFAQAAHKLAIRSTHCVFLGYSNDHKGYRYLDFSTNNIIVS
jgi:hypothetical protein